MKLSDYQARRDPSAPCDHCSLDCECVECECRGVRDSRAGGRCAPSCSWVNVLRRAFLGASELAPDRRGSVPCPACGGAGHFRESGSKESLTCETCGGNGWLRAGPPGVAEPALEGKLSDFASGPAILVSEPAPGETLVLTLPAADLGRAIVVRHAGKGGSVEVVSPEREGTVEGASAFILTDPGAVALACDGKGNWSRI